MQLISRQRIQHILAHREPDRIGLWDAYWEDTLLRWEDEGLPTGTSPQEQLGFDFDLLYLDASLRLPERVVEDTDEYTIREDKHGFVAKQWKGKSGALGYLSHVVRDWDDWRRLRRRLSLDMGDSARIGPVSYFEPFVRYPTWDALAPLFRTLHERERFVLLHVYGPFEATWRKHGFENSLINLSMLPGLMQDMFEAHTDLVIETLEKARSVGVVPDGLFLVEDLGINTGPMFAPRRYTDLLFPAHRRLGEYLHRVGIAFFIHSDGDVRRLIPQFIQAGIDVLQPMDVRAGLDVRALKMEYGHDLSFMGNIDARLMAGECATLHAELRDKITVAMRGGGYIYHSDHSVPPDVSWERYRWIIDQVVHFGTYF